MRQKSEKIQNEMTVITSMNPEMAMLWQGVIFKIYQQWKVP